MEKEHNHDFKCFYTTEIAGAITTNMLNDSDIDKLKQDPKAFALAKADIKIADDIEINFANNSEHTIHLALPYYDLVEKISSMEILEDQLGDVSGGEIFISLGIAIGSIIGGVTVAGVGWGAFAGVGTAVGAVIGGVVGAGVSSSIVAGAVVGTEEQRKNNK